MPEVDVETVGVNHIETASTLQVLWLHAMEYGSGKVWLRPILDPSWLFNRCDHVARWHGPMLLVGPSFSFLSNGCMVQAYEVISATYS